jgi:Tfp pilus assembly protein PilF
MAAIRRSDFGAAKELLAQEIARAPYHHEFHYWLAVAYAGLGDGPHARKELEAALETSTKRNDRAMYAAKLDRIKASATQ